MGYGSQIFPSDLSLLLNIGLFINNCTFFSYQLTEVTIIPTYDTDVLGYWIAENEDVLSSLKIDLAPSASRCTINLQDHDTSCSAYRLEF